MYRGIICSYLKDKEQSKYKIVTYKIINVILWMKNIFIMCVIYIIDTIKIKEKYYKVI